MRKALFVLLVLAAGVAAAFWLSDLGGDVQIQVGETTIATSFPIALLLLAAAFLVLHLILAAIGALRRWPARMRARRMERRRAEGDVAVTRALLALAAGTGDAARLEVRRARAALGDTPQTLLLAAEAERLAGRKEAAEAIFQALAQRKLCPLLAQPRGAGRAPLALAAVDQTADAASAAALERQAFEADPGFAPAALAHARRLLAAGNTRQARAALEEAWRRAPHPDLAEPYLASETDPLMRVKAAETLVRRNPDHPESRLLLARTAIGAGLTGRARTALEALLRDGQADRRAFLLLSELEEAEHGDTPEARAAQARWLREAATAPPEPVWRCGHCGAAQPAWAPVCDACNTVGQIGWTAAARGVPARVAAPAGGA